MKNTVFSVLILLTLTNWSVASPFIGNVSVVDPLCTGDCSGIVEIFDLTGTPPYTFSNPSFIVDSLAPNHYLISSFCEGTYSVDIEDSNGCELNLSVVITDPPPIIINSISISNPSPGGSDASVTVNASGGEAPLSYAWSTGVTTTTPDLNNLSAGSYSVQVIDNFNCIVQEDFIIPSTLPVELTVFEVKKTNQMVELIWKTASEKDNDRFDIQHSDDGVEWTVISRLNGAGNSTIENHYKFRHENPLLGLNYYRLRQVDFDGAVTLSKIKVIEFKEKLYLSVFPNPATESITIHLPISENPTLVSLYNQSGALVLTKYAFNGQRIALDRLKRGVYFIEVRNSTLAQTITLQKN